MLRSQGPGPQAWRGSLPWAFLGALGWLFVYADRAVLSPLLATFGRLFHVGPAQLGLVSTVFFLTYTAMQLPAGRLADRYSPRLVLGLGYIGFGACVALSALSPSYLFLLACTALAGLLQGTYYPTQFAVTARRIAPAGLALANAVITAGMGIGIAVGYLVAAAWGAGGWQRPVWLLGLLTVALGLVLWRATPWDLRPPRDRPAAPPPWRGAFGRLLVVNFCSLYAFFFLLAWLPYLLAHSVHLAGWSLGALSAWPTLLAVPATVLVSRATSGTARVPRMRRLLLAAASGVALLPWAGGLVPALLGLTLYGVSGKLVLDPLILSETAAAVDSPGYGQAFGRLNFVGMLAAVAAPGLSGWLVERTGGFAAPCAVAAALLLAGWWIARRLKAPG